MAIHRRPHEETGASTLREWLSEGPFSLCLSAGFFGFYAHAGFLDGLTSAGLIPHRLSGSSAGALVAAVWASGFEMSAVRERLFGLERRDFWDPTLGLGLLKGRLFEKKFTEFLNVSTFEECRVPLTISIFDVLRLRTHVVSSGSLNRAVRASCALPGLFQPVLVDGRWAMDGGVRDPCGFVGLPGEARVLYHHLGRMNVPRNRERAFSGVPARMNTLPVAFPGLPSVTPYALHRGPSAYEMAKARVLALMDRKVQRDDGRWAMVDHAVGVNAP